MFKCKICGKPSGRYQLCYDCYQNEYDEYNDYDDYDDYDEYDEYEDNDIFDEYQNIITNKINALYAFTSLEYFNSFVEELYDIQNWEISNLNDEERIQILKEKSYFLKLKKDFNSKNLSLSPITNKEILSYLDTLSIMYKILNNINILSFKRNATIIMEYVPKYNNGKDRCDYLITYKNIIIIFEFGKCKNYNIKETRRKKVNELDYYEKMIKKITAKTTLIKPIEVIYSSNDNTEEIKNITKLILQCINQTDKDALMDLIEA